LEQNTERVNVAQTPDNPSEQPAISPYQTLVSYLTGTQTSAESLHALAQICASPYALIMFKTAPQRSAVRLQDIINVADNLHICYVSMQDSIVAFLSYEDLHRFIEAVTEKGKAGTILVAFSLPFTSLESIPLQYELLCFCLDSKKDAGVFDAKDSALAFLTSKIASSIDTEDLLHPAIAKLARYDQVNQSNLLHTLKVYLENDRNAQRCANLLYLHRNSLQYRVRRIQEIAGINLDDPYERSYLRLSFLLSR